MADKNSNVVNFRRRRPVFLGILCLIFAAYLIFLFVRAFFGTHLSVYEVNQKQIADSENLRGIILREEELVTADSSGYVNYYVGDSARLATTTTVCSLTKEKDLADKMGSVDTSEVTLTLEDTQNIREDIKGFRDDFTLSDYGSILSFRLNVENTLMELSDVNRTNSLDELQEESDAGRDLSFVKSEKTGILSYCSDGWEDLRIDELTPEYFQEMTDQMKTLRTEKVKKGSALYRIVTGEKWSVVVLLTRDQYQKLSGQDTVNVTIKKDGRKMTAQVNTFTSGGNYYANLIFDQYMIHYIDNRYLDVEISFDSEEGLKIPTSSVLTKTCYKIPNSFITQGNGREASDKGVALLTVDENGTQEIRFVSAQIYYSDDTYSYIDADLFAAGSVIISEDSSRYTVSQTADLEGVYNCNQGYCVFEVIEKLTENEDYVIVKSGLSYSLSIYDHIILNPETVNEDDILH